MIRNERVLMNQQNITSDKKNKKTRADSPTTKSKIEVQRVNVVLKVDTISSPDQHCKNKGSCSPTHTTRGKQRLRPLVSWFTRCTALSVIQEGRTPGGRVTSPMVPRGSSGRFYAGPLPIPNTQVSIGLKMIALRM